jgi:adenine deaminase
LTAITPLIDAFASPFIGFCTDDRNPLDIHEEGHLDHLVRRAIALGAPATPVYRAASWSAARGFGLRDRGLLAPGYIADVLLLDDLETCAIHLILRRGKLVTADLFVDRSLPPPHTGNSVRLQPVTAQTFAIPALGPSTPVIGIVPGKILTERLQAEVLYRDGERHSDPTRDLLKVCVLERHGVNGNIGRGFVKGFGLQSGALASSVGHDSHNVCVVGANDEDMAVAVNRLIALGGGFVAARDGSVLAELALPFAGLMSLDPFETVHRQLLLLRDAVRAMGCTLPEPFLQLAFLPLPVIPHLKITDRGLVDVDRFELIAA